jgi:hypothetical protein
MNLRKIISELKERDNGLVILSDPWNPNSSKVVNLCDLKNLSEATDGGKYYSFYLNLIGLFADLSYGRNYSAINILKEYFPLDILIDVICDKTNKYEPNLRTTFTRLIESLYIDVFPYQELQIPHLIRMYDSDLVAESDLTLSCSLKASDEGNKLNRLTSFMLEIIQHPLHMQELSEAAEFYASNVKLCQKMIRLGYFKTYSEIKTIYDGIIGMVSTDWSLDALIKGSGSKNSLRFKESKEGMLSQTMSHPSLPSSLVSLNEKVVTIKMALCKILLELLYVETDFQITRATRCYKIFSQNQGLNEINLRCPTFEKQSLIDDHEESPKNILKNLFEEIKEKVLLKNNLIQKQPYLTNFLIGNTLSENSELKNFSLKLLQEMHSQSKRLLSYLQKLIVIESSQDKLYYTRALEIQKSLFKLNENMPIWYNNPNRLRVEYHHCVELMKKIDEDFKEAGNLDSEKYQPDNISMSVALFELSREHLFVNIHLQSMLDLLPQFYQNLLDKTGVIDHILKMITFIIARLSIKEEELSDDLVAENKGLLNDLILLICKVVYSNPYNKPKILEYLPKWLNLLIMWNHEGKPNNIEKPKSYFSQKAAHAESVSRYKEGSSTKFHANFRPDGISEKGDLPFLGNLIQVFIHVLSNSRDIIKDPSLTSTISHGLVGILSNSHRNSANYYLMSQVMHALEELTCDKDSPIKQNQSMIIKLLAEHNKEGVLHYYQNTTILTTLVLDLKLDPVIEEFEAIPVEIIPSKLCMDLAFVSLIGMCTYEKNEYSERIAQSFLPSK